MNSSAVPMSEQKLLQEGLAAIERGDLETARTKLFSVTEENPRNGDAWLGLSKIANGSAPRFSYLRKAFQNNPKKPEIQKALVEFIVLELAPMARSGNKEEAKKYLLSIVEFHPASEPAWLCLAFIEEAEADKRRCLENVLRINPNHQAAKDWLATLGSEGAVQSSIPTLPTNLDIFDQTPVENAIFDLSPSITGGLPPQPVPPPQVEKSTPPPAPAPPPVLASTPTPAKPVLAEAPPVEAQSQGSGGAKWLGLAAAAVLVLLIGGGFFFFRSNGTPDARKDARSESPAPTSAPQRSEPATNPEPTSRPATETPATASVSPKPAPNDRDSKSQAAKTAAPGTDKKPKAAETAQSGKPAAKPAPKGDREDGALVRAH